MVVPAIELLALDDFCCIVVVVTVLVHYNSVIEKQEKYQRKLRCDGIIRAFLS